MSSGPLFSLISPPWEQPPHTYQKPRKDNIARSAAHLFFCHLFTPGSLAALRSAGVIHDIATPWLPD